MSQELNQAIAYFNANQLTDAKKWLRKVKENSFIQKKLEFAILLKEEKSQKSINLGKQLLLETTDAKEIAEIASSIGKCYTDLADINNAERYFVMSVAQDNSIRNGTTLINLLKLYAKLEHFVNIEKLAPRALSWEKHSIEAQLILLESASKFGSKPLVTERIKNLYRDIEKLNQEQYAKFLLYLTAVDMEDLGEIAFKRFEDKFSTVALSDKITFLLKKNKTEEALKLIKSYSSAEGIDKSQYLLGKVLDSRGDYLNAFAAWEKGAQTVKSNDIAFKKHFKEASRITNEYNNLLPTLQKNAQVLKGDEGTNNVFIFGFPRSGTTLLDNVLDTQDDLLVLSERNILSLTASSMSKFGKKYPKDLTRLSDSESDILRNRYHEIIVKEQGYKIPDSGIIIEKGPHFTEQVPFIKALFPRSKLIVTIRHPLDVCLSCFQQNFVMSVYNSHLIGFEDIVNRYVQVFGLLERYEAELGIELFYVRYEDLIDDFESQMEKVFSHIGIVPNKSYLEFHKHAEEKFVNSASRGQTNQPIYQSSKYKWKKYADQLAPYMDDLKPFIKKFSYSLG